MGEMQAVVGMQLLEVLLILTRSQSNRQRLLALGLLRALATAMKVSPQRIWRSVAKFRGSHCLGRRREGGGGVKCAGTLDPLAMTVLWLLLLLLLWHDFAWLKQDAFLNNL